MDMQLLHPGLIAPIFANLSLHRCSRRPNARLRAASQAAPPAGAVLDFTAQFDVLAGAVAPGAAVVAEVTPLGRGVVLTSDVAPEQVLLSVDWANLLCVTDDPSAGGNAFGARVLGDWQALHGPLPPMLNAFLLDGGAEWATRLAAWLLHLRNTAGGVWAAYTRLLPLEEEMTCLMNYTDAEMGELQDVRLRSLVATERQQLRGLHDRVLCSSGGELRALRLAGRFEDTLWAMCMVNSRCFEETIAGEEVSLLVPCCDMANHVTRPNIKYRYNVQEDCFQLVAAQAIPAGTEACINYGCVHRDNAELMRDYGFILPANLNDRIPFATADDVLSQRAAAARPSLHAGRLLAALGITCSSSGKLELTGESAPEALLAADDDATVARRRRVVALLSLAPFLRSLPSAANAGGGAEWGDAEVQRERGSVAALRQQCREMLAAMPTSAESDEALLLGAASGGLGVRRRQAVAARLEIKRAIAAADAALQTYAGTL